MALARKRHWYFEASWFWTIVWAILTLGTWPLLLQSYRFDRFRRLEWNQYQAFAQWLGQSTDDPAIGQLQQDAESSAGNASKRLIVRGSVLLALVVLAVVWIFTDSWFELLRTVFWPHFSLLYGNNLYSAALACGIGAHLGAIGSQRQSTTRWISELNSYLQRVDRRPIPLPSKQSLWGLLIASAFALVLLPGWLVLTLFAVVVQNHYLASTRAIRLALLERMLEWMDASGLPVEFDIEEVEPDELVSVA